MTSRLLLTLLALLTGLSAQGSAVHARAVPGTMQVAAVSTLATVQSAKVEAVLARPAPEMRWDRAARDLIPVLYEKGVPSPTVLTGIDRARE